MRGGPGGDDGSAAEAAALRERVLALSSQLLEAQVGAWRGRASVWAPGGCREEESATQGHPPCLLSLHRQMEALKLREAARHGGGGGLGGSLRGGDRAAAAATARAGKAPYPPSPPAAAIIPSSPPPS